jgi:4-amino-4-deoxy-L-arabinose transferase-like glycosyltransferase
MKNNKSIIIFSIMGLTFSVLIILNAFNTISTDPLSKVSDAKYYIRMGYNILNNSCFSGYNSYPPKPSAFREPLYALYLSAIIAVSPELKHLNMTELVEDSASLQHLRYAQIPILLIISMVSACFIYCITGKLLFSCFALILTGFSASLINSIGYLMAEHLAVMFLLLSALFFYKAIKTKKCLYLAGLGVFLALLVLTKAIFMYFIFFVIIFLLIMKRSGLLTRSQLVRGLIVLLVPYAVLIGGWMIRNYIHFDDFYITNRRGAVMSIRAEYNKMNATEYFGSFLYWMPGGFVRKFIFKTYGDNALEPEGALGRLNRSNLEGYYRRGKALTGIVNKEKVRTRYGLDEVMRQRSINEFLSHPVKEMLVSIPIFWRGIFYSQGLKVWPLYDFIMNAGVFSITYFLSFLILIILTIKNRIWELFSIISMPLYLFILNALATHGLSRYNLPALGVAPVCFLAVVFYFINKEELCAK